jgi:hypothetical protein
MSFKQDGTDRVCVVIILLTIEIVIVSEHRIVRNSF